MDKLLKAIAQRFRLLVRKKCDGSRSGASPDPAFAALRRQLDVLQESEQGLRITLLSIGDGVITTDHEARITFLNPSAQELMGWTLEQALGRPFPEVFHIYNSLTDQPAEDIVQTVLTTKRKVNLSNHTVLIRPDGTRRHISDSAAPIHDAQGNVTGVVLVFSDVTERYELQRRLRLSEAQYRSAFEQTVISEQRLKRAQELSHTGNWEIDLLKRQMWASDEAFRIYGFAIEPDNQLPLAVAQSAVVPEHRELMDEMLERLLKYDAPYDVEFSICRFPDGNRREVHSIAVAERDASGQPLRVIGVLQDITERRQLKEEYGKALSTTLDGFWLCDKNVCVTLVNDAICSMLGYTREEIIGRHVREFEAYLDPAGMRAQRERVLASGAERFETKMRRKDGSVLDVEVSLSYIPSSESTCAFMRDITERKCRENRIRYLSYHDVLTGLYNRAFFEEECARLDEKGLLPVSVVMGDINGLKLTNDVFGHAQGDKLLCAIAKILSDCARPEDFVVRIGGDEFCLLMPCAGSEEAKALCERILFTCERETVHFDDGSEMYPSVAVGYATRWTAERSFNETFKEAEDAMYKRKLLERKSLHSTVISSIRITMYEKSRETREHADRLTEMACSLGRKLELDDAQLSELELLCSLHDLGKIGIPEHILDKPGPLTEEEWFEMRKHPEIGYRIAQASPELMGVAEAILCHHERWDGKGYPQGLKENSIPLLARILSVADSFDAMTYDRVYHKAISREQAFAEIEACAGSQFDPEIAALFVRMMRDER
ncbi:MAG: PAS domain S-box protein [Clostridia bacterium]|jgi:diguanylate cyclase (GGDEF)-like protein/PAS domain S-box-containing protein|nr:PAS domain S-box protein [Clostridia bacterium]